MSFLVAILYAAILGVLFEHSFFIEPDRGGARRINVVFYPNWQNIPVFVPALLLFLIDWVAFHIVFFPSDRFSFNLTNALLLIVFLPSIFSLGLSIIFAYESGANATLPARFCLASFWYHLLALIAEITWFLYKASQMFEDLRIPLKLIVVLLVYAAARIVILVMYFVCYKNPATNISPPILGLPAVALKPTLLVFLWKVVNLPGLLPGGQP